MKLAEKLLDINEKKGTVKMKGVADEIAEYISETLEDAFDESASDNWQESIIMAVELIDDTNGVQDDVIIKIEDAVSSVMRKLVKKLSSEAKKEIMKIKVTFDDKK